jgi:predicted RNase H-like HicB family nuclease
MAARKPRPLLQGVVLTRSGRWWAAELPSFPGAHGQGRTRAQAYQNLLSAIRDLIDTYAAEPPTDRALASRSG